MLPFFRLPLSLQDLPIRSVGARARLRPVADGRSTGAVVRPLADVEPRERRLYHLRRGPLLGTLLQHPDDIALAQSLFLAAPLEPALRQMMPAMCEFIVPDPGDLDGPRQVVALQVRLQAPAEGGGAPAAADLGRGARC